MPRGVNPETIPKIDFRALPLLLNEKQCAEVCGVSLTFLRVSRSEGPREGRTPGPKFVKINGSVRYPKDEIERWTAGLMRRTAV